MTFYYGKDLGKIIKHYSGEAYNYKIKYLDGSEVGYYCPDEKRGEILEKIMLTQAENRDKVMFEIMDDSIKLRTLSIITNSIACAFTFNTHLLMLFCLNFILLIFNLKNYIDEKTKLNELKKYRIFLAIQEELKKEENKGITDILSFDKIYQIPILNINTIDEFSLKDVKKINEELTKRKKLKAN